MNKIVSNKLGRLCFVALLGIMIFSVGCKKDDKVDEKALSLDGTSWKGTYSGNQYGTSYTGTVVVSFQQSNFTWVETDVYDNYYSPNTYTINGTYTYNHPTVILQSNGSGSVSSITGTVSGNQMSAMSQMTNGQTVVLTKQ